MKNILLALIIMISLKGMTQCDVFEFSLEKLDAWCHDSSEGSITVNASEGTPPYIYEIRNEASELVNPIDSNEATDLVAGDYSIYIIDASGCELFDTITVNSPDPLFFIEWGYENGEPGSYCTLWMTGGGGVPSHSYEWTLIGDPDFSSMSTSIGVTEAGCYIGTVTDSYGCILSDTACVGWLDNQSIESDFFSIFYSPLDNSVNFKGVNLVHLKLYTIDGRLIMDESLFGANKIIKDNFESIMIYEVISENGTIHSGRITRVQN